MSENRGPLKGFKYFLDEQVGIRGLLGLDDDLLSQVRELDRQVNIRRPIGQNIQEYRALLQARIQILKESPYHDYYEGMDQTLFIFQCAQAKTDPIARYFGMVSFTVVLKGISSYALISDPIVEESFRNYGFSRKLIDRCLDHAQRLKLFEVKCVIPGRSAFWLREILEKMDFEAEPRSSLYHYRYQEK